MDPNRQIRVIWAFRWWIALATVVAGVAAFLVSKSLPPTYKATALVQIVSGEQASGNSVTADTLVQLTNIYEQQARATTVVQQAAQALSPPQPQSSFEDHVSVAAEQQAGVLSFQGSARAPAEAARYANSYAQAFVGYLTTTQDSQRRKQLRTLAAGVEAVRQQLASADKGSREALTTQLQALQARAAQEQLRARDTARPLEQAVVPTEPSSPKPVRDAILVMLVALILATALAYLRSNFSNRYGSADEVAEDLDLPLLGIVPDDQPESFSVVEALRLARATIEFTLKQSDGSAPGVCPTLVITSAEAEAGKTFTTSNLARVFASGGHHVLAVDGDLHRPTLHSWFDVALEPGLSDALVAPPPSWGNIVAQAGPPARITRVASEGDLDLLTAGKPFEDDSEHLLNGRVRDVLAHLQRTYDFVLLDSPPVLAVADAAILARHSTGVILVINARKTRRREARRAMQALTRTGAPIVGIIVNRASKADDVGYYSYAGRGAKSPAAG